MEIKVSIRNLIEFVLRTGSLDNRYVGSSRMLEGTMAHQRIQRSGNGGYRPEVALKLTIEYKGFLLTLDGRADGIFEEEGLPVVEEIKSTTLPLEAIDEDYNLLHWAQAKCYAFIYGKQNNLEYIGVKLTYSQLDSEESKCFIKTLRFSELEAFFYPLLDKYLVWAGFTLNWGVTRDNSIKNMKFPFASYRKGQRDLVRAVYKTITSGRKLFAQAPTGIGKTVSTLFPAVKAIGEGKIQKIFYLTARTTTRQVAEEAFVRMKDCGLEFKTVTLTAKEKICFNRGGSCNPEQCSFAEGYYDRVNDAVATILSRESILTREVIEEYAKHFGICPFEYSLDLTLWSDCIICDYNYVFDPRVYLKRFFQNNKGDYAFLVDEAHNLVDRAREMYSAELSKNSFLKMKKAMKTIDSGIYKTLVKINKCMLEMGKQLEEAGEQAVLAEEPEELYPFLRKFVKDADVWLSHNGDSPAFEDLQELYFDTVFFLKVAELFDERYVTHYDMSGSGIRVRLFCLDPSHLLREALKAGKTAVFFSATLTPLSYFRSILGGDEDSYSMKLPSPFFSENLCLLLADSISTKYRNREGSYEVIAEYIKTVADRKTGNYMVYFPSYRYMNEVAARFMLMKCDIDIIIQSSSMAEEDRAAFLDRFRPDADKTLVGFCVMGGIFSEGVDLAGDRLIGAVIVGVGLPQLSPELNIIMNYFNEKNGLGYEYAYMFPGMNKVLQAAGRVIRTENDRGVVLLIDERFSHDNYQELFPDGWSHYIRVRNVRQLEEHIRGFWE